MSSETTKTGNAGLVKIAPVMFAFFVMGFVDLVGTATNYVKAEFDLANGTANLFTTMVFFWFLIFAVPTGMLMNKIGRRKTVLWSILVTLVAMALPIIAYVALSGTARLVLIVISFAFLGIGNTLMQVSLNPLLTVFVKGDKLASTLTLGQFVKSFASLFAPYIAIWGATQLGMWWILFVIYLVVGIAGYVLLAIDKIDEPAPDAGTTTIGRCFKLLFSDRIVLLCFLGIVAHVGVDVGINAQAPRILTEHTGDTFTEIAATTTIGRCFKLLFSDRIVLLCFLGIVAHVGVDVGINAQAPRILTEHTGDTFTEIAATATMVYFVARMIGCFTGGIVLSKISNRVGILVCGTIMTASAVCFAIFCSITSNPPVALFWVAVALVGFGNSNVFSLFLSHALMYRPERQNEISGLMLMGLIGGAIFPPIMGALADAMSAQLGAIIVMSVGCIYVLVIGIGYKAIIEGKKAAVKA